MYLRTLGGVVVPDRSFHRPKPLLLLAYLALEGATPRRYLAELFWPSAANPRQSLATALSQLRSGLPGSVEGDAGRAWTSVACDAAQFLDAVTNQQWQQAAELYAGTFMDGVDVDGGNVELEEWLFAKRESLAARAVVAFVAAAEAARIEGDRASVGRSILRATAAWQQAGDQGEELLTRLYLLAAATGHPTVRELAREAEALGIELPAPSPDVPPEGLPVPSLPRGGPLFVGRERELSRLEELLGEGARLVTITGLGGIGKTTLALALARRLQEQVAFPQVFFVSLETTNEPERVLEVVAAALIPSGPVPDPLTALRQRLGLGRSLLVLDCLEHLLAGAEHLAELLEASLTTSLLVTSRVPLGLDAETLYALEGLAVPRSHAEGLAEPDAFGALKLYHLAARRHAAHHEPAAAELGGAIDICRLVGGAPLGIELAAALTRVVPAGELAQLLEADLDALVSTKPTDSEKHATLRTLFERSWALLSDVERSALAGCGVFRGGFTLAAARGALGLDLGQLAALMDKSLLSRSGSRYDLHPLVRQYAMEKLAEGPAEQEVRARHAEYFAGVVEATRPADRSAGQRQAFDELDRDQANIRSAWQWACTAGRPDLIDRMTHMLGRFLYDRQPVTESTSLLGEALASVEPDSALAGRLLLTMGRNLAYSDHAEAQNLLERAVELARTHEQTADLAAALHPLGTVYFFRRDFASATAAWQEALRLLESEDPRKLLGGCYSNLAILTSEAAEQERLLRAGVAACRRDGNSIYLPTVLGNQADFLSDTHGDFAASLNLSHEALATEAAEANRAYQLAFMEERLVTNLLDQGDTEAAEEHLAVATRLYEARHPWEDHKFRIVTPPDPYMIVLHSHRGEIELAKVTGEAAVVKGRSSMAELARIALAEGNVAALMKHTDSLARAMPNQHVRGRLELEAFARPLEAAAVAMAARAAGADSTPSYDELTPFFTALRVITDYVFVPRAYDAFVIGHLLGQGTVEKDLLELAATQPGSRAATRRLAALLLEQYPSLAPVRLEGVPAPPPSTAPRIPTEEVMRLARGLLARFEGFTN